MFKEMLYPDNSSFKFENLLRFVLYLILTPVAFVVILVKMIIIGLEFTLLVFLNTLADNLNQVMAKNDMDEMIPYVWQRYLKSSLFRAPVLCDSRC